MERRPHVIAIVEDDPSMRRGIERLLNAHGFATEGYASAEAFLAGAAADRAACAVLDIHLDGMSGIELRRRLTTLGFNLPVIFVTGTDDQALELEAVETGCIAYLHKPFPPGLLIEAVNKAMGQSARRK